jgi:nucleoside-triphosphatase
MKIGITGLPGVGKTETLLRVVEKLEEMEYRVGGMVTECIMKKGCRVGFNVRNWCTDECAVMSHIDIDSKIRIGKYGVNLDALESIGACAIEGAVNDSDVIIIDEVGKMEVECDSFVKAVKNALDTDKSLIMTLHKKSRNPLLQDIRRRDDVRILEVTPVNRNLLPYKIIKLFEEERRIG